MRIILDQSIEPCDGSRNMIFEYSITMELGEKYAEHRIQELRTEDGDLLTVDTDSTDYIDLSEKNWQRLEAILEQYMERFSL